MTQDDLAAILGVSRATINQLEQEVRDAPGIRLNLYLVLCIAEIFEVPWSSLVEVRLRDEEKAHLWYQYRQVDGTDEGEPFR